MSDDEKTIRGVPEPDDNRVPASNNPIPPLQRVRDGEGETRSNNPIPPKPKPAPAEEE
jgi:hypothetical protein